MDSLSQLALGAAVGHVTMGDRIGRRALVYGAILGTLPDLDILVPMGGAVEDFTYHRGASHSWFVHAAITPPLVWLLRRLHRTSGSASEIPSGRWALFVFGILFTHALLDAFTIYGTQVFWPLASPPVGLGSIFIIDPLYTLPLLVGCGVAWFARDSARRWRGNAWGLALSSAYLAWTLVAQQLVLREARSSLADRGIEASHVLATPSPFNTLLWRVVAIDGERWHEGFSSLVDGSPVEWHAYARNPAWIEPLDDMWAVRRLDWFTRGFWSVRRDGRDVVVEDLRMGLEPEYVFRFRVGTFGRDGVVTRAPVESRGTTIDPGRLGWIFARIWSPAVAPPVVENRDAGQSAPRQDATGR